MPVKIKNFKYKNSQGEYVDMISTIDDSTEQTVNTLNQNNNTTNDTQSENNS